MARNMRAKRADRPNPREDRNSNRSSRAPANTNVIEFNQFIKQKKKVEIIPRNFAQEDLLASLLNPKVNIVFAVGPAGTGKAQPLDCNVLTNDGWKKMGDIQLNEKVITPSGKTAEVIGIFPQGTTDVYEMAFIDGRTTKCSGEHLWRVYNPNWSPKWQVKSTYEIMDHSALHSSRGLQIQLIDAENSIDVDLPVDPWFLGFLLGDGSLTQNPKFTTSDSFILEKIKSVISRDFPKLVVNQNSLYDFSISLTKEEKLLAKKKGSKEIIPNTLKSNLLSLGLMGLKSYEKHIPEIYLNASKRQKIALVQGLMDSDGTTDHGGIKFSTTSFELANQVQKIIWSLGGICSIGDRFTRFVYKGIKKTGRKSYGLSIRYKNPKELLSLPRKLDKLSNVYQYSSSLKLKIKDIKKVEDANTQCIMINDEEHLYITDDYIVTHNTYLSTLWAIQEFKAGRVEKLVITRPNVAVDDKDIGFLPGDIIKKLAPWCMPILDVLGEYFSQKEIQYFLENGIVEMVPIAFIRGRTFKNAVVLVDEAQGTTANSMLSILTRIGEGSKMVITGDTRQSDRGETNGLSDFLKKFKKSERINVIQFSHKEIERHPAVAEVLKLYGQED